MSTLRDGASPSDKARKLVAELVEVSDKYHNGTHAKSWQIWAVNEIANALAAAPSLHKEGPDAQLMYETYEQYRERLHKEGAGGEPPDEWWKTEALDVIRSARVDGDPPTWERWRSSIISGLLRAYNFGQDCAALPLQRTLPDEQFKGVVVEAIGADRDAVAWLIERGGLCLGFCERKFTWLTFTDESALRFSRRSDAIRFIEAMRGDMDLEDVLVTEHMWDASPAGRAEQEQKP